MSIVADAHFPDRPPAGVSPTADQPAAQASGHPPVANPARLPIIDAARGAAALMVCALHAREIIWVGLHSCITDRAQDSFLETVLGVLSAPLALGGTAVSLFFVISGYCIHRSFALQLAADPAHEPGWRAYFIRRAWRIYPVLIAVLLITLLLDQLTIHRYPDDIKLGSLSFQTMLVNLCALQGVAGPYFGSNGPLWTLSLEIQLYAMYPVVFYLTRRRGINASVRTTLTVSLICTALGLLLGLRSLTWFGPYWFCWTLGCAVAEFERSGKSFNLSRGRLIVWFLISAAGFGLCLSPLSAVAFSCTGCFWALILLKGLQAPIAGWCRLPLTWLAKLGLFSYSLYAVHKPVCLFLRSLFFHGAPVRNILFVLPVMAGCVGVAAILFLLVERYSLRVPKWLRQA
jgi:peptidoglycan/LPS O-acetylase OafA/YrhL